MKNIVIIGSSGTIGSELTKQLAKQDDVQRLYAFSRSGENTNDSVTTHGYIDLTNEASIQKAADTASQESLIDVVIVASGILHDGEMMPEKSLRDLSVEKFEHLFAVNTIGAALVMKHFLPKLHKNKRAVFAVVSARVGSISDNHLGGWYAYRASKAALNMLVKNASIEVARLNKQAIIAGLHPGTVDSDLSKPFQQHVKPERLFTPEYAASQMLQVLKDLTPENSGKCFAYDGTEVPA